MKKILIFIIITFIIFAQQPNSYNIITRRINCSTEKKCFHEIGHAIDQSCGWESASQEYAIALNAYILRAWNYPQYRDEMVEKVLTFPGFFVPREPTRKLLTLWFWADGWGGTTELYADMFAWTEGKREKMPEFFRDFYDWNLAEKLVARYIGD